MGVGILGMEEVGEGNDDVVFWLVGAGGLEWGFVSEMR
jgi:hypothetical protein